MSTLLATTNPEAVKEIEPDRDRRAPYVGQVLVYYPRPGEGRSGKISTAAIVTEATDEDHADLLIIWDADDFITRRKVPRKTEQNPINAWGFNSYDEKNFHPIQDNMHSWRDIDVLFKRIADLDTQVAQLSDHVKHLRRKPRD